MTENTLTPIDVASKVLDVRNWLEYVTNVDDSAELRAAAISGEFESQMGQTIEEYVSKLLEGADAILEKIPKIQSLKQCDFESRKVLEKIVMVLAGAVDHAKWLTNQSDNAVRHRFAMQAVLSVIQELSDKYSYALFDAAAGIRVRRVSQVQGEDTSLPASASDVAMRQVTSQDVTDSWPWQAEVARGLKKNRYEITRLIAAGKLKTNGKDGHECRVDPASILEYCSKNGLEYSATL